MNRVYQLRTSMKMTQDEFAERCNVSKISIVRYEGGQEVSRTNAVKIASACGVSIAYVIGSEEMSLTEAEMRLLSAYRSAEETYQIIALELLESHQKRIREASAS